MRFTTKEDIEAPIGYVFEQLTDFARFERAALRRGADLQRLDTLDRPGAGMCWQARFRLRGRQRDVKIELTSYDPVNGMMFASRSDGLESAFIIDLIALSRNRTRLSLDLDLRPRNLAARLLVQSLKLAKTNLMRRYRQKAAEFAQATEDSYRRSA